MYKYISFRIKSIPFLMNRLHQQLQETIRIVELLIHHRCHSIWIIQSSIWILWVSWKKKEFRKWKSNVLFFVDLPQLDMDGEFFDDPNDEFKWFSSGLLTPTENNIFDTIFPDVNLFEQGNQEPPQQIVNIHFQQTKFVNLISLANTSIKIPWYSFDK